MEHREAKCASLKKKCLLQIGKDDNFPVEWLTDIPRELLEKLKKYCSAIQLLRLDNIFTENDVDTSWEWRRLSGQKFGKWSLWSRVVYAPERYRPFIVGLEHFRVKQIFCSLLAANLMKEISFYHIVGKQVTGQWEAVVSLLPHVKTLSMTPDTLSHISQRWGPLNVVNLKVRCPSSRRLHLINVINSISLTSLQSLSVEYIGNHERDSNGIMDLVAFLEAVFTETKSHTANTTINDISESKNGPITYLGNDSELGHSEATIINMVCDEDTPVHLEDISVDRNSKAECDNITNYEGTTNDIQHLSDATAHVQDDSYNSSAEGDFEDSIDLYEEALSSEKHEGLNKTIDNIVGYVQRLVAEIKADLNNQNYVDDYGLESLKICCSIFSQEEWCRFCKLFETWTSLRRISFEVNLEFEQRNCTFFSSMIIQKVGYGQLTHLKLSGTSDILINTTYSLLVLLFELFRADVSTRVQPLQYLGLEYMEEAKNPLTDIVNLADLYPYQIQAAKQVDLSRVRFSLAMRKNVEHFLSCNVSLVHLSWYKSMAEEDEELSLPQLYQIDLPSKRFLDTVILNNMKPRQGGEITLIMRNVPLLKRFCMESCDVYKDIDDEFLCALSSHKHLAELEIGDDNLASEQSFLDVVFQKGNALCLRSLCLVRCQLSGSSIVSAVQQACDQLPHRRSCLLEYLNLTYNFVTIAQRWNLQSFLKKRVKVLEVDCSLSQFSPENEFIAQM